jgi:hypothetical protein
MAPNILGGYSGAGPEHIARLRALLDETRGKRSV